jgi:hypothetical protein
MNKDFKSLDSDTPKVFKKNLQPPAITVVNTKNNKNNLDSIKSLAAQLGISTFSPKEKILQEKDQAERKLRDIQNQIFLQSEINTANREMDTIKEWQFLRSEADKD